MEKYSLNLPLDNTNNPNQIQFLTNLDDWVTDNFIENDSWLNILNIPHTSSKNDIKKHLNTSINYTQKLNQYINLKLIFDKTNNFFCEMYVSKQNKIRPIKNIDDIKSLLYIKNIQVSVKMIISNIYIQDKKYGVTLKPKHIIFYDN